jgi:hypothetical protein
MAKLERLLFLVCTILSRPFKKALLQMPALKMPEAGHIPRKRKNLPPTGGDALFLPEFDDFRHGPANSAGLCMIC